MGHFYYLENGTFYHRGEGTHYSLGNGKFYPLGMILFSGNRTTYPLEFRHPLGNGPRYRLVFGPLILWENAIWGMIFNRTVGCGLFFYSDLKAFQNCFFVLFF